MTRPCRTSIRPAAAASILAALAASAVILSAQQAPPKFPAAHGTAAAAPVNELDAFMEKVLEHRNENWRLLHDYILSEREAFQILGPGDIPLHGQRRDFQWFIRDGFLVRSPVKANGATLSADDRQKYERDWMTKEQERDRKAKERAAKKAAGEKVPANDIAGDVVADAVGEFSDTDKEVASLVGGEPRFISEANFMKFRFEPGNYYLAGRDTIDGRPVIKVEYYPTRMFNDDPDREKAEVTIGATGDVSVKPADAKAQKAEGKKPEKQPAKKPQKKAGTGGDDMEDEIERAMNKVTLVTMWIDPVEFQVVRFTFDNVDFNFLPGRAIVRVDNAKASMTMGRYFDNVWLPKEIVFRAGATFAAGSYTFRYTREFYDYRKGEVSARIRAYVPKEP